MDTGPRPRVPPAAARPGPLDRSEGSWQFGHDDADAGMDERWYALADAPTAAVFDRDIRVPYPPESPAGGIGERGYHRVVWYRRTFDRADAGDRPGERVAPAVRGGGLPGDGLGQRPARRRARGRPHAVRRRRHRRPHRRRPAGGRRPRRGRPARPHPAPGQAGLAGATRTHLVRADDGDLAAGVARAGAGGARRRAELHARPGRSVLRVRVRLGGRVRRRVRLGVRLGCAARCWPTTSGR